MLLNTEQMRHEVEKKPSGKSQEKLGISIEVRCIVSVTDSTSISQMSAIVIRKRSGNTD